MGVCRLDVLHSPTLPLRTRFRPRSLTQVDESAPPCITVAYAPKHPGVDTIMGLLAKCVWAPGFG
jgi:hypothetical protein